ncbi:MAG TPA: hypothetical protein VMV56_08355 [Williamwhitmania sp.]|nr:hypothetical protein [Williamwhitmania sp.]
MKKGLFTCFAFFLLGFSANVLGSEGNSEQKQVTPQPTKVSSSQPAGAMASSFALEIVSVDNTASFVNFSEEDLLPYLTSDCIGQENCENDSSKVDGSTDSTIFINGKNLPVPVL